MFKMPSTSFKSEDSSTTHHEVMSKSRSIPSEIQLCDKHGNLLVPQPINDANDPLNWSALRKAIIITTVAAWTFLGTFQTIVVGPAFFAITADLHNNFDTTTYLVGGPAAVLWRGLPILGGCW